MTNNRYTTDEKLAIAETIFAQLGGKRRLAMFTGAKNFAFSTKENGDVAASFRIGRGGNGGINHVEIVLTALDLYDVTFRSIRGTSVKVKSTSTGVYADMLRDEFEAATGLYLTF